MPKLLPRIATPESLSKWMQSNIRYGYIGKDGKLYIDDDTDDPVMFDTQYRLSTPTEVLRYKVGVCWDQAEFERQWFTENNIPHDVYYIKCIDKDGNNPTHTFLTYYMNGKYYHFENSWYTYRGIWEYNSIDELLESIATKHTKGIDLKPGSKVVIHHLQDPPKYGINDLQYMRYAEKQPLVYSKKV